jgi:glycosyltransferase involved in cell wall biosynthesis
MSVDPNGPKSGQVRYSVDLLTALAETGIDVTVLHLGWSPPDPAPSGPRWVPVGVVNRGTVRSLFSELPAMASKVNSPGFRDALRNLLEAHWDAVVLDHLMSGWAVEMLQGQVGAGTVLVYASQNDETAVRGKVAVETGGNVATRFVLGRDARKVAALESTVLGVCDIVTTVSAADADAFAERCPGLEPLVLTPGYDGRRVPHRTISASTPRRAVVAGSLYWRVKQHDLLALLRTADRRFAAAGAEIVVVGDTPEHFARRLREDFQATQVLGRVDSLEAELGRARLALVSEPSGGGFKLKALDYVFHRVPMLVEAGSVTGLPLAPGSGVLEFPHTEALVEGALAALDDFELLNRLQVAAFDRCAAAFEWKDRALRLRAAVERRRSETVT